MLNFEHVVSIQLGYAAAYLERVPMCTRRFETRYQVYVQIQCNTGTYSRTFFPSAIRLWITLPVDICQLSPDSFKTHQHRTTSCFYRLHCTVFYWKLLFIVCCTAFSIHICLFTPGAILLGIESAPSSEDEDIKLWFWLAVIIIHSPGFSAAVCRLSREAARIYQKRWTFLIVN